MDVQRNLQTIAQQVLGSKLSDNKTIQLWEHYVTNNVKTLDDFRGYLCTTDTYLDLTRAKFSLIAPMYVGNGVDIETMFHKFISVSDNTLDNTLYNTSYNIQSFLVSQPEFNKHINGIISDMVKYEQGLNELVTDECISFYRNKFIMNKEYGVGELSTDVQNKLYENENTTKDKTVSVGVVASPTYNTSTNAVAASATMITFQGEFVQAFENVFQRPIFVQEYFKYIAKDGDGVNTRSWEQLYSTHCAFFNQLREVFEYYTGKTISEYYYVNRYLFDVDKPDFFQSIVDEIISSPEYKAGMSKVLTEKYTKLFDIPINDQDLAYTFEIVKKQKLGVIDEKIHNILTILKEETDKLIGRILKVYVRVLERPPDMNEIEQYVGFYRLSSSSSTDTDEALETILMLTLEFHDSIKKRIKKEHFIKMNRDVLPSVMFDILNRVIMRIATLTMKNIDEVIAGFI